MTTKIKSGTDRISEFLTFSGIEQHQSIKIGSYSYFIYLIQSAIYNYGDRNNLPIDNDEFTMSNRYIRSDRFKDKRITVDGKKVFKGDYLIKQFVKAGLIEVVTKGSFDIGKATLYQVTTKYKYGYITYIKSPLSLFGADLTSKGIIKVNQKAINEEFSQYTKTDRTGELSDIEKDLYDTISRTKLDLSGDDLLSISNLPQRKADHYLNRIISYISNDHWVSRSELSNRLYSSFASLPRSLRKKIKIKNAEDNKYCSMGCLDLKCAQPFLLSYVIKDEEYSKLIQENDIYLWCLDKLPTTIIPAGILEKSQKENNKEYGTRDWMKIEFYRFIFTKTSYHSVVDYIFEQNLPIFFQKVKMYKQTLSNDNYMRDENGMIMTEVVIGKNGKERLKKIKKPDTECKSLAVKLQEVEASIFIPVWLRFRKSTLPLHDSIYFPEGTRNDYRVRIHTALVDRMCDLGYVGYVFNED